MQGPSHPLHLSNISPSTAHLAPFHQNAHCSSHPFNPCLLWFAHTHPPTSHPSVSTHSSGPLADATSSWKPSFPGPLKQQPSFPFPLKPYPLSYHLFLCWSYLGSELQDGFDAFTSLPTHTPSVARSVQFPLQLSTLPHCISFLSLL